MKYILLATGLLIVQTAFSASNEFENEKFHCVFFKNNKIIKQQNCIADGYTQANAFSVSTGYDFKNIKGYGKISTYDGVRHNFNEDGNFEYISTTETIKLNNKTAIKQYRMPKTFKILNQEQYNEFSNTPQEDYTNIYECFYHKTNAKYEFCFKYRN